MLKSVSAKPIGLIEYKASTSKRFTSSITTLPKNKTSSGNIFPLHRKYQKIKYQGLIYKIGEFIEIFHLGANSHYVAKLVNIASVIHDEKSEEYVTNKIDLNCPMIQVEWYMKKSDLSRDPKY